MNQKPEKPKKDEFLRLMARYGGLVGLIPASIFAGYLLGYGLDYLFSTTYLRIVFLFLGFASGVVHVIRDLGRDVQ